MREEITRAEAEAFIKSEIAKAIAKTVENVKAGRPADAGLVAEDISDPIPKPESAEVIYARFNGKLKKGEARSA